MDFSRHDGRDSDGADGTSSIYLSFRNKSIAITPRHPSIERGEFPNRTFQGLKHYMQAGVSIPGGSA
jgi:hypothetical protein